MMAKKRTKKPTEIAPYEEPAIKAMLNGSDVWAVNYQWSQGSK
jgi:hypothetical protein